MANVTATAQKAADTTKNFIPKKEFWIYSIAGFGQCLAYSCMSSYVTDYYMSVLRLAPIFVLLLMLLARVWDAINDPMMGIIIDRTRSRFGKMRHYAVFTAVPIAALTILMFYKPNLSGVQLCVYAAIVYVLFGMVYTMSDVPYWSLPNIMTPNPTERGKLISISKTCAGISTGVVTAFPLILGPILAKDKTLSSDDIQIKKYLIMAIACSIVGMAIFSLSSFFTKERIQLPNSVPKKRARGEKSTLSRIFHCKPLMLVVLSGVLSFGRYMMQAAAVHVGRYGGFNMVKDTTGLSANEIIEKNISSVTLIIQICVAIGMFGAMIVVPFLYKKFNYKQLMIYSCIVGFVASILNFFIGWATKNLYLCIPTFIISSIPLGIINVVTYAMVCDSLDFMEYDTGHRDTALGSACQSFVNKLGNALSTVLIIAMYMIVNINIDKIYSSDGSAIISLTAGQNAAMFSLVTIVPGVSLLLCAIPLFFYDLVGSKMDNITNALAKQRAEKGIEIN